MATNKLLIQDINGKVGIGTTNPLGPLHVSSGTSGNSTVIIEADTDNDNEQDVPRLWFKADGGITEAAIQKSDNTLDIISNVDSASGIRFFTGSTNNTGTTDPITGATQRLVITSSGSVGIGTTAPEFLLDVVGSSGNTWARVISGSGGTSGGFIVGNNDGGTENYGRLFWDNANNDLILSQEYTNGSLKFRTNTTERMRLDTSGNLFLNAFSGRGGGSTGYLFKLNPGKVYFELMANNTTSQSDILFSDGAAGEYGIIGYNHSNDSLRFYTNGAWNMTVDSSGNVGIGTTNPGGKLAVLQNTSNVTSSITTAYKSGGNSNLFSTGLIILAQANNSSSANTAAYIDFEVRNPALNGSHGTSGYIVLTHGSGTSYGNGQFDFYIRNNTPPYTFNNDSAATSDYWMSSVFTIKSDGNVGVGTTNPFSKLQVGSRTFNGGNGMYIDGRVGISNHGNLTGLMLASTYNEAAYPEYGLVFVQGPNTSNYNVWSLSPDGPARGNSLNFIYGANETNIHVVSPKVVFRGDGNVGVGTTNPSNKLTIVGKFESRGLATDPNYAAFLSGIYDSAHALQLGVKINSGTESEVLGVYAEGGGVNPRTILNPTNGWNVGIGTTTPGTLHRLAVQGATRIKRLQKQIYNWYTTSGNSYVHVKTNLLLVSGQVGMWVWRLYGYSYGGAKIVDAYYGLHSDGSGNIYSGTIQNQGSVAFGTNMYKSTDNYLVLVGLVDSTYFFGFDIDVHHTMDYGYSDLSIISITQSASSTGAF